MSGRKWELSDAALKRIRERIRCAIVQAAHGGTLSRIEIAGLRGDLLLDAAMEPEQFARPAGIKRAIVERWILEGEGVEREIARDVFWRLWSERDELRAGARDLMSGIRRLARAAK